MRCIDKGYRAQTRVDPAVVEHIDPNTAILFDAIQRIAIVKRLDQRVDSGFRNACAKGDPQVLAIGAVLNGINRGKGRARKADGRPGNRDLPSAGSLICDEKLISKTALPAFNGRAEGDLDPATRQACYASIVEINGGIDGNARQGLGISLIKGAQRNQIGQRNGGDRETTHLNGDRNRFGRSAITIGKADNQVSVTRRYGGVRVAVGDILKQDAQRCRSRSAIQRDLQISAVHSGKASLNSSDLHPINRHSRASHRYPSARGKGKLFKGISAVARPCQRQQPTIEICTVGIGNLHPIVQQPWRACACGWDKQCVSIRNDGVIGKIGKVGRIAEHPVKNVPVIPGLRRVFAPRQNDGAPCKDGKLPFNLRINSGEADRNWAIYAAAICPEELYKDTRAISIRSGIVPIQDGKGPVCQGNNLGFILGAS